MAWKLENYVKVFQDYSIQKEKQKLSFNSNFKSNLGYKSKTTQNGIKSIDRLCHFAAKHNNYDSRFRFEFD